MPTDYERDLARIGEELARLEDEPASADRATRIAHCLYRRAAMTGDLGALDAAEAAADAGIEELGPWPDLCFVFVTDRPQPGRSAFQALSLAEHPVGKPFDTVDLAVVERFGIFEHNIADHEELLRRIFALLASI